MDLLFSQVLFLEKLSREYHRQLCLNVWNIYLSIYTISRKKIFGHITIILFIPTPPRSGRIWHKVNF